MLVNVIEQERMHAQSSEPAEARYCELLDIALTDGEWAEGEHILALSLILNVTIFVFSSFRRDQSPFDYPSMDPIQLQQHFRDQGTGTFGHVVYCSRELSETNRQRSVHQYDSPPLCLSLNFEHYTALMYRSPSALLYLPVPYQREYST